MKAGLLLILFALWSATARAQPTVCSMTFNSDNEIRSFQKKLKPLGYKFHELVPQSKDPNWFENACKSGIKCDVLVMSGHFGGLFFGEKTSPILKLTDLERAACLGNCQGILGAPKEVFLMGCNTLASKKADKRTPMEYLRVLVSDGFPRDEAEKVVTARYSQEGFSIAQRMAVAFPSAERLHGFDGTGPLGAVAAPRVDKYLASIGNYEKFLAGSGPATSNAVADAFAGYSIRSQRPSSLIDEESRAISCHLRFGSPEGRKMALRRVLETGRTRDFIDHLRDTPHGDELRQALNESEQVRPGTRAEFESVLKQSAKKHAGLLSVQSGLLKLSSTVGLSTPQAYAAKISDEVATALSGKIDQIVADQVCDVARAHPSLAFSGSWLQNPALRNSEYLPYIAACFLEWESGVSDSFKKALASDKLAPQLRGEVLRALKGRWSGGDSALLSELAASSTDPGQRYEIYRSSEDILRAKHQAAPHGSPERKSLERAFPLLEPRASPAHACLQQARSLPSTSERDGARWQCLEKFNLSKDLWACLSVAGEMEVARGDGMDWQCLLNPSPKTTLGLCLDLAERNPDPEKSDDMRWSCWDRHRDQKSLLRAECLRLAASMKIEGNRIKANWNCMNMKNPAQLEVPGIKIKEPGSSSH
jgi:hypothetical protein